MPSPKLLGVFAAVLAHSIALAGAASAEVKLPSLFSDHAVLQRDVPLPIWGTATPGEVVTLQLAGQTHTATADAQGQWLVRLDSLPAGGPHVLTVRGSETPQPLTASDLLIGEVWLTSGQSNMEFRLPGAFNADAEIAAAGHPLVRHFNVEHNPSVTRAADVNATWQPCSPETARTFSAVPYFFSRDLHAALKVPVGIVNTSFSGTPIEAWLPRDLLEANPDYARIFERERDYAADFDQQLAKFTANQTRVAATNPAAAKRLKPPPPPDKYHRNPSLLYNGMVAPLQPFAFRGMLWYQGEANAVRAWQYRTLLPDLIRSWRSGFGHGDFPVFVVQLAAFQRAGPDPAGSAWAELREAQLVTTQTVPNTALAVTIDIGDPKDIHPRNKQEVGRRLALLARSKVYGETVDATFPTYARHNIEGSAVRIHFAPPIMRLKLVAGDTLTGFTVAGADRVFHPAHARIDGNTVVVSSAEVPNPVAARYGWASAPVCNLASASGLPATPFRTDDWPALTLNEK